MHTSVRSPYVISAYVSPKSTNQSTCHRSLHVACLNPQVVSKSTCHTIIHNSQHTIHRSVQSVQTPHLGRSPQSTYPSTCFTVVMFCCSQLNVTRIRDHLIISLRSKKIRTKKLVTQTLLLIMFTDAFDDSLFSRKVLV